MLTRISNVPEKNLNSVCVCVCERERERGGEREGVSALVLHNLTNSTNFKLQVPFSIKLHDLEEFIIVPSTAF